MFFSQMARLVFRAAVFIGVLTAYFMNKEYLLSFVEDDFFQAFGFQQALWIVLMLGMIHHLVPTEKITMGLRKSRSDTFQEAPSFEKMDLYEYVQDMNVKAWRAMLVWLIFNAIFAALYLSGIIGAAEMILLTIFYYLSDMICVMIFCPFQTFLMKNRCCISCRIYDWGHFMIFTPMLFVKSFFSWSLFFTACVVLIRWEMVYASHPERFYSGSNKAIQCEHCSDRLCRIKKPIIGQ